MIVLVLGIILWWAAHLQKSLTPRLRDAMTERFGEDRRRGIIAGLILLSVVLMIIGFRMAPYEHLYETPVWGIHANNALMFVVIFLMGLGRSSGRARCWLRHPMLLGVLIWAGAHLLVNGDLASIILFGGLLAWAVATVIVINRTQPVWVPKTAKPGAMPKAIAATIFAVVGIMLIHNWLGVQPWGG